MTRRISPGTKMVLATHNPGKVVELQELLAPFEVEVVSAGALGLPEPDETEPDFVGNARLKAQAATISGLPALADDSGFSLAALGGAPGVLSARWAGPGKDFAAAQRRAWHELGTSADHRAWFTCALCLAWPGGDASTFLGRVEGHATWPPRGTKGFGYDSMFTPLGSSMTYGEMEPVDKHATSHRARAMMQLLTTCFVPGS